MSSEINFHAGHGKKFMQEVWKAAWCEMRESFDMYDIEDKIFEHSMRSEFERWYGKFIENIDGGDTPAKAARKVGE